MPSFINTIEMLNHFKTTDMNRFFNYKFCDMKTDYHNIMMTTLNLAVKECLKQNNLFDYQEYEYDEEEDFEDELKDILNSSFNCSYGVLNELNILSNMNDSEEFEKLFNNLGGLDMIQLIQNIIRVDNLEVEETFIMSDFNGYLCFRFFARIYINRFLEYHEETKEQYIDCKIHKCKRFLNETCLLTFHNPHTKIGKARVKKLYQDLLEIE